MENLKGAAREQMENVADEMRDLRTRAKDAVREKYDQARHLAQDYYGRGRERAAEYEEEVVHYVRQKPLVSLLIAAGAGALLGMLLTFSSRSR